MPGWNGSVTYVSTDTWNYVKANAVNTDVRFWGGNVDAGGNSLTNLGGIAVAARLDVSGGGATLKGSLTNSSARPAIATAALLSELRGLSSGGFANDDGFLRLRAGGGSSPTSCAYIDLSGYSTVSDMADTIVFGTVGVERMRIAANGNVGIGTTSPLSRLSLGNTSTGFANRIAVYEASSSDFRGIGMATPTGGVFGVAIWANKAPSDTNADVFVKDGGFVGIGTGTPTSPLQVVGVPVYANNAAAIAGGLTAGAMYRTGANPDPVCIVH